MTNSPIATAIAPLRDAAIDDANAEYNIMVAKAVAKLEAAGWDLDVAAPRPNGNMDRGDYMRLRAVCGFFSSITRPLTCGRRIDEPDMVALDEARVEKVRGQIKAEAAASFEAYAAKLEKKVGAVVAAELMGDSAGLWSYSVLTVTLADGTVQRWKTQRILNCSGLGTLFHQWPTRLIK
jgi:hypothetical protein